MVANLIWVGCKELIVERFKLEYQELHEGIYLVQTRHTRFFKAYVPNFNFPMNVTPKMNEFSMKGILLGGLKKSMVEPISSS